MTFSINHSTFVISIPKADTIFVETNAVTGYEVRSFDEYDFMRALADYLDSEEGASLPNIFTHNTSVTISGVVYARTLSFLAPYTITFENDNYQVKLTGGTNNNMLDVLNPNSVSVIPANSAGLQVVSEGGGSTAADIWSYANRQLTTGGNQAVAVIVRAELTPELSHLMSLQSSALSPEQATMLLEMYRLLGLDPTKPLVITQTERRAGPEIVQSITGDGTTISTVTRQ